MSTSSAKDTTTAGEEVASAPIHRHLQAVQAGDVWLVDESVAPLPAWSKAAHPLDTLARLAAFRERLVRAKKGGRRAAPQEDDDENDDWMATRFECRRHPDDEVDAVDVRTASPR